MKKVYFSILLGLIITGCKEQKIISIDNPTEQIISFEIDDLSLKLNPLSTITYELSSGTHKLRISSEELDFEIPKEGEYLLNPTKNYYFLEEIIYGRENWDYSVESEKINKARKKFNNILHEDIEDKMFLIDTISAENYKLIGFYKKTNDVVIRDIWDYGINQKVPGKIKKAIGGENVIDLPIMGQLFIMKEKGKVKLYRSSDFIKKLDDN